MSEPVFDPIYWKKRLANAIVRGQVHRAVFHTLPEVWGAIADRHREILQRVLTPETSVLDAGCGWGRLLSLVPSWWKGAYLGIDLSPDFIETARSAYPDKTFSLRDLRQPFPSGMFVMTERGIKEERSSFDLGILISVRPMIVRNCGQDEWNKIEENLKRVCHKLLYLEYDKDDLGELVVIDKVPIERSTRVTENPHGLHG